MNLYNSSEITVHKLNELKEEDKKIQILDVREDTERDHAHIKGTIHIRCYRAPENFKTGIFNKDSDIWTLGCLLFEMLFNEKLIMSQVKPIVFI